MNGCAGRTPRDITPHMHPPINRLPDIHTYFLSHGPRIGAQALQAQFPEITFTHERPGGPERPLTDRQGAELLSSGVICVKSGTRKDPTLGLRLGGLFHATEHHPSARQAFTHAAETLLTPLLNALNATPGPLSVQQHHTGRHTLHADGHLLISQDPGDKLRVHRAGLEALAPGNHLNPDDARDTGHVTLAGRVIPARIRPGTDVVEAQLGRTYLPVARPHTIHPANLLRLARSA